MDDRDLDDAALWASVDTAVAEASRRALPRPPLSPAVSLWPAPDDDPHRGEAPQPARPFKLPRVASHAHARGRATPLPPPPSPSSPPPSRPLMLVQSPHPELPWVTEPSAAGSPAAAAHGLFPSAAASVASFRKYQEVAVSGGGKYRASTISHLKSRTTLLNLMTATMSTVLNFLSERLCKVAGSQMVGVHVIDGKRDSTSQTMISPAQLKQELRTKLVRIFLASAITVRDE